MVLRRLACALILAAAAASGAASAFGSPAVTVTVAAAGRKTVTLEAVGAFFRVGVTLHGSSGRGDGGSSRPMIIRRASPHQ